MAADRTRAQPFNVRHDTGEELDKQRIGFIYEKRFNEHHAIKLRNYYTWQQFEAKLPIPGVFGSPGGWVEFNRLFMGGGAQWTWSDTFAGHGNRFIAGFEIDDQDDDRTRYFNNDGSKGALSLDQNENVTSYGIFLRDEFDLTDTVILSAGARYDLVEYQVADHFLSDGDDSLDKDFEDVSASGGALWHATDWASLYANVATSFETPTTTQLANPTGGGGFNASLQPTTSIQYEVGARGEIIPEVSYDLAVFHTEVSDELIGYISSGRAFFSNADTTRTGVEAQLILRPWQGFRATFSYTWSDFEFDTLQSTDANICAITVCDGKRLPGVPMNRFYAEAVYYHPSGWYFGADFEAVGDFHADNENQVTVEGYQVANMRFGRTVTSGQWEINPFVGVNNLFGTDYNSNIRINETRSRYFEPAPERNI
ncbi:MAG: TonB-dependent receptor, partial [Gammaproteobacteria bacterium]